MIVVSGTVAIRPDKREEAVAAAVTMANATAAEKGCLTYRFYADIEDPHLFRIFEEWETEEALQAHFQTPHMAAFNQTLPQLVAGPADIKMYVVAQVSSM